MKKVHKKLIADVLLLALALTGCGRDVPEAPPLMESLAANESFRPVEYGDIGLNQRLSGIVMGTVSPAEYCHFFPTTVQVSEVCVSMGDYVSAGDVIAIADVDACKKTIDDLNGQLANLTSCHEADEAIYNLTRKIREYEKAAYMENGDSTQAAAKETEIGILDENRRYDNMLYEHKVSDIKEDIAKNQEIVNDGALKARVSGTVVYCKDLSEGKMAAIDENIVVIADYDDCYIEVLDLGAIEVETGSFDPSKYETIYTVKDGEKKHLEEYSYSKLEKIAIENKSVNPPVRFYYADGTKLDNVGEMMPIFFIMYGREGVLRIEKESLYEDGEGDYVYVKTENGKEKRYVELGTADKCYREVVSGLSEGELVYYSAEQVMPDKYDTYTVSNGSYEERQKATSYTVENTTAIAYYLEYEGVLSSIYFNPGDYVNAGDVVCQIKTDKGNAMLTEKKNSIDKLNAQHTDTMKAYDEQIAAVEAQIYELDHAEAQEIAEPETATVSDAATPSDAEEEFVNPYARDMLDCEREIIQWQKKLETINYEYQLSGLNEEYEILSKNNDGNGNISIYANESGTISDISVSEGKNIPAGTKLFFINTQTSPCVSIHAGSLGLGQQLTFQDEEGKVYYGEVVGLGSNGKSYITTMNDTVYVTRNLAQENMGKCYISMEDKSFYELEGKKAKMSIEYSVSSIPGSIVLPGKGIVYKEVDKESSRTRYYVWKIVDDTLVKKYITLASDIDGENICVIEGLLEGDVLATEPVTKEE